jgi:hypothetical protein
VVALGALATDVTGKACDEGGQFVSPLDRQISPEIPDQTRHRHPDVLHHLERLLSSRIEVGWSFVSFDESHPKALTFQSDARSPHAIPAMPGIHHRWLKGLRQSLRSPHAVRSRSALIERARKSASAMRP